MTATTCCTPKPLVYQIQVIATRSQFSSILSRTTTIPSSTASATVSIPELHPYIKVNKIARNDVNNNNFQKNNRTYEEILSIPNDNEVVDNISEAEFLAMVGLRHRTRKKQAPISLLRPLAKRLAGPICLLPLPKHSERVRQALYILLPFLKFLSITHDVEPFCAVNNQTQTENLSTRLVTQIRTPETMYTKSNKRKVSKAEFINMAVNTFRNKTRSTPMAKYIHSTIQCQVALDRLDQATIDQIMDTSTSDISTKAIAIAHHQSSSPSLSSTSINKTTAQTTSVQHKSTTTFCHDAKRFKTSHTSSLTYQRIYLKCFVCSKREYIDASITNSDILHSHWLEHGHNILLNIYDSEVDSILTRIVEFFHFPRQHILEGKIQTIFILNSKELRRTPPSSSSSKTVDDKNIIILD